MTHRVALGSFALLLACGDLSADTGDAGGPEPGCDDAVLLDRSDDPTVRGPWPVGTRDVMLGDVRVAVWYPAEIGSDEGTEPATYDIRDVLPPSQQDLITDEDNPLQVCDCARDLPLDTTHGPYPFVVFVHGTAAWRSQSLTQMTHWASRGFVVIAADHPGLKLGDVLTIACPDDPSGERDLERDVDGML